MTEKSGIIERRDRWGIPYKWGERLAMGVCIVPGCRNAAQGIVPGHEGPWAHDCPCCLAHCTEAAWESRKLRGLRRR